MRKAIRVAALTLALTCPVYAGVMVNLPPSPTGLMPNLPPSAPAGEIPNGAPAPAGEIPHFSPAAESQTTTAGIVLSLLDAFGIF